MEKNPEKISEVLERGVEEVIVREELEKKLQSGKKLRVKLGIDPTAPDLHLGHLVPLRKLRAFQELGHTVVLIMGDFTAMIGDPTGRSELRKPLTREQTRANAKDYLKEASRVLDVKNNIEIHYNSEWLDTRGVPGLLELASKISVQRAIEREDFRKRMAEDHEVSILETLYPLLQGYDSVAIRADVELGGTDQKFNLLMGRRIQRKYDQPEQHVMTLPLVEGTDGVRKMSKSYGNYIAIKDEPANMYGKVMSIPDQLILKYFVTFTGKPLSEIQKLMEVWEKERANFPARDLKMELARDVVTLCHDEAQAQGAEEEFTKVFQRREKPEDMKEHHIKEPSIGICELMVEVGFATSKSEARRLVEGGGVRINDAAVSDPKAVVKLSKKAQILNVGKRHFVKVRTE